MNRRYSLYSNASFQIPNAANATAIDLLLDDTDSLEREFFADEISDLTLRTPVPNRIALLSQYDHNDRPNLQQPFLQDLQEQYEKDAQSRIEPHDGRESSDNIREPSPTPRASKVRLNCAKSEFRTSRSPTPVAHNPRQHKETTTYGNYHKPLNAYCLPSAAADSAKHDLEPPKTMTKSSKQRISTRKAFSPSNTRVESVSSQPGSHEPYTDATRPRNTTSQEDIHRLPAGVMTISRGAMIMGMNNYSDNSDDYNTGHSESGRARPRGLDPQFSEVTITKVHPRPESCPERGPFLPDPGSGSKFQIEIEPRDTTDAVTRPIKEVNGDLQGKGNEVPISKLTSVVQGAVKSEAPRLKRSKPLSRAPSSVTGSASVTAHMRLVKNKGLNRSRPLLLGQKQKNKRLEPEKGSGTLTARKRRRISNSEKLASPKSIQRLQKITRSSTSDEPIPYSNPSDTIITDGTQNKVTSSSQFQQPAKSEVLSEKVYSTSVTDTTDLYPSGNSIPKLEQGDIGEVPDEVQDFLSRYAKKYRSGGPETSSKVVNIHAVSKHSEVVHSAVNAPAPLPKCHDVRSEVPVAPEDTNFVTNKEKTHIKVGSTARTDIEQSRNSREKEEAGGSAEAPIKRRLTPGPSSGSVVVPLGQDSRCSNPIATATMLGAGERASDDHLPLLTEPQVHSSTGADSSLHLRKNKYDRQDTSKFSNPALSSGSKVENRLDGTSKPSTHDVIKKPLSTISEHHSMPKIVNDKQSGISNKRRRTEPRADDMFARRKRDNYLQKGIDLTAHSSRRFSQKPSIETSSRQNCHESIIVETHTAPKSSESDQSKGKKITESLDFHVSDHGLSGNERKNAPDRTRSRKNKTVTAPAVHFDSHLNGKRHQASEKCLDNDINVSYPTDPSSSSMSSSIVGQIAVLGQKVMDSLGLFNSQTQDDNDNCQTEGATNTIVFRDSVEHTETKASKSQPRDLHFAKVEQSPRIVCQSDSEILHDDGPSDNEQFGQAGLKCQHGAASLEHETRDQLIPRKRSPESQDRNLDGMNANNGSVDLTCTDRKAKRAKFSQSDDNHVTTTELDSDFHGIPSSSRVQPPPSVNDGSNNRNQRARNHNRSLTSTMSATVGRNKGVRTSVRPPPSRTGNVKKPQNGCSLTIPVAPTFTSDILRQRRMEAKSERESIEKKVGLSSTNKSSKSDVLVAGSKASSKALPSNLQPNSGQPTHSTVHRPGQHETDDLTASRRKDFEEKLKLWEKRASTSEHDKLLPNFKTLHAAQKADLATIAARRHDLIKPTVPVSPNFIVDARLAEREKFDKARREREKEAERIKEEKQREIAEIEKLERREARKRTIPRANAVPDWYIHAPKKSTET